MGESARLRPEGIKRRGEKRRLGEDETSLEGKRKEERSSQDCGSRDETGGEWRVRLYQDLDLSTSFEYDDKERGRANRLTVIKMMMSFLNPSQIDDTALVRGQINFFSEV